MTHKPHTPPQPGIEDVGEKPDFEKLADELHGNLWGHSDLRTFSKLSDNINNIEEALQQAHEAGVAQGRGREREYIAGEYEKRGATHFQKEIFKDLGKEIRALPPQGDKK